MDEPSYYTIAHPEYFEPLSRRPITTEYIDVLRPLVPADWARVRSDIWLHLIPPHTASTPQQGFKIHLSCAVGQATTMLRRVVPILVDEPVSFKIAGDPSLHRLLNSKRYGRGGSGKFITVYPPDHDAFRALVEQLVRATQGLDGPHILSDKRCPESRVVFYRYGAFQRVESLMPDGTTRGMIRAPDGSLVRDERRPYFWLPDGVVDAFPDDPAADATAAEDQWLNGRYEVVEALSFSNTGGIYRAIDHATSGTVVIKEARPHTLTWIGRESVFDATAVLCHERACLERLAGLACVPAFVEFFKEWEHAFLVVQHFDGVPLNKFKSMEDVILMTKMDAPELVQAFCETFRQFCLRLLEAMDAIHERGIIVGDISPGNVLIDRTTGEIGLIDFEGAVFADTDPTLARFASQWCNPGFRRDERRRSGSLTTQDDYYACGILLYHLVCPIETIFELDKDHPPFRILDHFIEAGLPAEVRTILAALMEDRAAEALAVAQTWQPLETVAIEPAFT